LEASFFCFVGHRADFYDFVGISEGFWTGIEDSGVWRRQGLFQYWRQDPALIASDT
jgi:hypothetical protein